MRGGVREATLAIAVVTVVASSGIVQAGHVPSWQDTLELGKMPGSPDHLCDPYANCQELRGMTIQDHDVSDYMDERDEPADYVLKDLTSYAPLTVWRLCTYDGDRDLIGCDERGPGWYLWGELPTRTDTVRVILKQNAGVTYGFRLG